MFPLKPPFVGDCPSCHVWFPGAKPTVATGTQLLCPRDGAWMDFSSGPGGSGKIIDVASCFQVCLPRGKLKHCDGDLMWFTQVEHGLEAKSQTQSQTAGWKRNCLALGFCWKEQLRFVLRSFRKQMLMWVDALHKQARGLWILGWHHMFFFHIFHVILNQKGTLTRKWYYLLTQMAISEESRCNEEIQSKH